MLTVFEQIYKFSTQGMMPIKKKLTSCLVVYTGLQKKQEIGKPRIKLKYSLILNGAH